MNSQFEGLFFLEILFLGWKTPPDLRNLWMQTLILGTAIAWITFNRSTLFMMLCSFFGAVMLTLLSFIIAGAIVNWESAFTGILKGVAAFCWLFPHIFPMFALAIFPTPILCFFNRKSCDEQTVFSLQNMFALIAVVSIFFWQVSHLIKLDWMKI